MENWAARVGILMKRFFLLLALALVVLVPLVGRRVVKAVIHYEGRRPDRPVPEMFSVSCKVNSGSESPIAAWTFHAEQLSTEPTTWEGTPGAAVTIRFKAGPEQFEQLKGLQRVSLGSLGVWSHGFEVPVMKLEPQAMTVFFVNDAMHYGALREVCKELEAGTLRIGNVLR